MKKYYSPEITWRLLLEDVMAASGPDGDGLGDDPFDTANW